MQPERRAWLLLSSVLAALAPRRAYAGEIQSIMDSWFREIAVYVGSVALIVVVVVLLRRLLQRRHSKDTAPRA